MERTWPQRENRLRRSRNTLTLVFHRQFVPIHLVIGIIVIFIPEDDFSLVSLDIVLG